MLRLLFTTDHLALGDPVTSGLVYAARVTLVPWLVLFVWDFIGVWRR